MDRRQALEGSCVPGWLLTSRFAARHSYRWNRGWAFLAQIEDGVSWIATSTGGELEVPLEVGSVQDAFRRLLWTGAWEGFYGPAQLEALPSWIPQACVGRGCCVVLGPRYSWRLLVGSSRKQVSLWFWRTSTSTRLLEMFHGSAFHRPILLQPIRGPGWFLLWREWLWIGVTGGFDHLVNHGWAGFCGTHVLEDVHRGGLHGSS